MNGYRRKCPLCGERMKRMAYDLFHDTRLWKCGCGIYGWDSQIDELEREFGKEEEDGTEE